MTIDLYYMPPSPPCRSVIMTAKMVGIELNLKMLNPMTGDQMKPEFLAINPQHNIPTIVDNGLNLNESRAICTYLINQYAKDDTLYPKNPKVRALIDQRLYFDMGVFYHRFGQLYYPVMMHGATQLDKKAQKDLAEGISYLEGFLSKTKYAAGDHLTIADIALVASASTMEATDKTLFENSPQIKNWLKVCKSEILDYQDTNHRGAEAFGQWAQAAVAKLELSK